MVVIFAFVTFIGALGYLSAHKRSAKRIDRPSYRIDSELDKARRLKELACGLLAESQRKQQETELEAAVIVASAQAEAKQLVADTKAKVDEIVAYRTKLADSRISQAEVQALTEVRSEATESADSSVHAIQSGTVKENVADHLGSKSLDEVKDQPRLIACQLMRSRQYSTGLK
jgi:F-type H+-transporting ATPase subunit b